MVRIKKLDDEPRLTLLQLEKSNDILQFKPILPPSKKPRKKTATLDRLSRYFYPVFTKTYEKKLLAKTASLEALRSEIAKLDYVEACFISPEAQLPVVKIIRAKSTPNFVKNQFYLEDAPRGVSQSATVNLPGGKGDDVNVVDVEGGWDFRHEDLQAAEPKLINGVNSNNAGWLNHGTAVFGEIASTNNSFGVTGIAPNSKLFASSIYVTPTRQGPASAAFIAGADHLRKGDIMLIELHAIGPNRNFIAMEWWPDNFDALKYATEKGVIVIEAAGNGNQNLNLDIYNRPLRGFPPEWKNPFNRDLADCGAVLVGAGAPVSGRYGATRSRLSFSNYGSNVDVQGYGYEVCTTGYGDLFGGTDRNRMYTNRFSGTSSASPIVVGAVAALQGYAKKIGKPLTPESTRRLLRQSGSPQQNHPQRPVSQRIGNLPNLKQLVDLVKQRK